MNSPLKMRIPWVDTTRGFAIVLIVFWHSHLKVTYFLPQEDGISAVVRMLALVRLPAFFIVSGILTSRLLSTPWREYWRRRLLTPVWLVLIWTILRYAFEQTGLVLSLSGDGPTRKLQDLFWIPHGNLWFLYVLTGVALLAKTLHGRPLFVQIPVTFVLMVVCFKARNFDLPGIVGYALYLSALQALPMFMIGVWGHQLITRSLAPGRHFIARMAFFLALGAWAAFSYLMEGRDGAIRAFTLSCGMLSALLALASLISLSERSSRVFGWIGQRSAQIFVTHQFVLSLVALLFMPESVGSIFLISVLLTLVSCLGSLIFHGFAQSIGLGWLYVPPAWVTPTWRSNQSLDGDCDARR